MPESPTLEARDVTGGRLAARVDALVDEGYYPNRSELVREAVRRLVTELECEARLEDESLEARDAVAIVDGP